MPVEPTAAVPRKNPSRISDRPVRTWLLLEYGGADLPQKSPTRITAVPLVPVKKNPQAGRIPGSATSVPPRISHISIGTCKKNPRPELPPAIKIPDLDHSSTGKQKFPTRIIDSSTGTCQKNPRRDVQYGDVQFRLKFADVEG